MPPFGRGSEDRTAPDSTAQSGGMNLDAAPPRPPRSRQSLMSLASDGQMDEGFDMSSPAVQAMSAMGEVRTAIMKLSTILPPLASGLQQVLQGLESVVPQMVADIVAGNPPGSSGAGMGAPQATQSAMTPPVSTGMP